MVIGQTQTYLGLLAFTALVGSVRGWRREIMTSAVLLAALLFVNTGGGVLLANLFTHGTSSVGQPGANSSYTATSECVGNLPTALANLSFAGLTFFGYRIGRMFVPNFGLLTSHRFTGMLIGAVNGAVIAYYVSANVLRGGTITLGTPGPVDAGTFFAEALGMGIVGLLLLAFIVGQANRGRAQANAEGAMH
jgi:hypothetical protein